MASDLADSLKAAAREKVLQGSFLRQVDHLDDTAAFVSSYLKNLGEKTELAELAILKTWLKGNPSKLFDELREKRPFLELPPFPKVSALDKPFVRTVILSDRKHILEILQDSQDFSVEIYGQKMTRSLGTFMLGVDGTDYNDIEKRFLRGLIRPEDYARFEGLVKVAADDAVREAAFLYPESYRVNGKRVAQVEVVNGLGRKVPLRMVGDFFGFPGPDRESMFRWSRATQDNFFRNLKSNTEIDARSVRAAQEMKAYIEGLVRQKRQLAREALAQEDTILARMLLAETPALPHEVDRVGQPIGAGNLERTIVLTTGFLIGAGETTQGAVTRSLEYLLRPGNEHLLQAAVAAAQAGDDALVARFVWEALRFNPVNQFLPRVAKRDYTLDYGGVKRVIRAGTLVLAATQSAMFDESFVQDPRSFVVDEARRPFTLNDEADVYYHLGVASHRCLGDRLSLYQVPQMVKALLLKPGLRRAAGDLGRIDNLDAEQGGFPERFYVEFDAPEDVTPPQVQVGDPRTSFEDYLNDYDRAEFLACLDTTGKTLDFPVTTDSPIFGGSERSLFWCRLNSTFRACVIQQAKSSPGFPLNRVDDASVGTRHRAAKDACRTRGLTETEDAFYEHVMLGGPAPDPARLDARQAASPRAYEFEAALKFYNRAQYRDRLRNRSPLGNLLKHGRDPSKDLLYARLPLEFRQCFEGFGADVKRFDRCRDGQTDPVTGVSHGGLTPLEKTYFSSYFIDSK